MLLHKDKKINQERDSNKIDLTITLILIEIIISDKISKNNGNKISNQILGHFHLTIRNQAINLKLTLNTNLIS